MKINVLDIGGTSIKSAVCVDGELLNFSETDTDAKKGGEYVMTRAEAILKALGPCDGIGISTAGQVDAAAGRIVHANENIPAYTGMQVRERMERIFSVPVAVENDVNAAAIGEGRYGAAKGRKNYLCLTYGTGVGGAIVTEGTLYRGAGGSAGEFGSIIIHGQETKDGQRLYGSYEMYASTTALIRNVQKVFPAIKTGREVFERRQEPGIAREIEAWIKEISHGLVSLIHIFNPEAVILGGGVMAQASVVDSVRRQVQARVMQSFRNVEIVVASLGNQAGLRGAAYLAEELVNHR